MDRLLFLMAATGMGLPIQREPQLRKVSTSGKAGRKRKKQQRQNKKKGRKRG